MTEDDVKDMIDAALPAVEAQATKYRTQGLSPKVLGPIGAPLSAVVYALITTGTLDRPSLGLLAVSAIGALWAVIAGPGTVVPVPAP